jgi:hypothetical protein
MDAEAEPRPDARVGGHDETLDRYCPGVAGIEAELLGLLVLDELGQLVGFACPFVGFALPLVDPGLQFALDLGLDLASLLELGELTLEDPLEPVCLRPGVFAEAKVVLAIGLDGAQVVEQVAIGPRRELEHREPDRGAIQVRGHEPGLQLAVGSDEGVDGSLFDRRPVHHDRVGGFEGGGRSGLHLRLCCAEL